MREGWRSQGDYANDNSGILVAYRDWPNGPSSTLRPIFSSNNQHAYNTRFVVFVISDASVSSPLPCTEYPAFSLLVPKRSVSARDGSANDTFRGSCAQAPAAPGDRALPPHLAGALGNLVWQCDAIPRPLGREAVAG